MRAWVRRKLPKETMFRLSVGGLGIDLLIAASTLAPGAPLVPQWPQFVLFPVAIVVQFSSMARMPRVGSAGGAELLDALA